MCYFTIIIPVYNTEKYISDCIESIQTSSFTDFEIVIVNDGSTDGSEDICRRYERNDHRIRVINQVNSGLSAARNAGISEANGKYVFFVDSDDMIMKDALKDIFELSHDNSPDVIITEMFNTSNPKQYSNQEIMIHAKEDYLPKQDAIKLVTRGKRYTWPAVQYIVRLEFILNNGLQFAVGRFHEDIAWTSSLIELASTFCVYPKRCYLRRTERKGSIMSSPSYKRMKDGIELTISSMRRVLNSSDIEMAEKEILLERLSKSLYAELRFYNNLTTNEKRTISKLIYENIDLYQISSDSKHKIYCTLQKLLNTNAASTIYSIIATIK